MSIAAKDYHGNQIGSVTISANHDEKGHREVFESTAFVCVGKIGKAPTGLWVAVRPNDRESYHDTRGKAAGALIEAHRNHLRNLRIEGERADAALAAEQMIANCTTEEDVELGRLYQALTDGNRGDVHRIDQGYNPAGRDAIVLDSHGKLQRVKLLGHRERGDAPAPDLYAVDWGSHVGSVIAGIVIPTEVIEAEQAAAEAAARRPINEAITRVEDFLAARAQMSWMDDEPIQEISGNHPIRKLTAADLRTLLEATRSA